MSFLDEESDQPEKTLVFGSPTNTLRKRKDSTDPPGDGDLVNLPKEIDPEKKPLFLEDIVLRKRKKEVLSVWKKQFFE